MIEKLYYVPETVLKLVNVYVSFHDNPKMLIFVARRYRRPSEGRERRECARLDGQEEAECGLESTSAQT